MKALTALKLRLFALRSFLARREAGKNQLEVVALARHLLERATRDNVLGVAASLAYTSLLGLVPLLAMGLAVLSAFSVFDGVRDQMQKFIFTTFVPASGLAVQEAVQKFVAATGKLTAVGVVSLAVISVVQMLTIERAFNHIFRVQKPRPLVGRLVMYWTLLTVGPLLVGTAFAVAGYLATLSPVVGLDLARGSGRKIWLELSATLPFLLTCGAFTLLYTLLPHRRIRLRDAGVGALVAASLFAGLRYGFVQFYVKGGVFQTIYGALATVPLFLVWTYSSWLVVLFGAEVAATLPEWRAHRLRHHDHSKSWQLFSALEILRALWRADGKGLRRTDMLRLTSTMTEDVLLTSLAALQSAGLVIHSDEGRWTTTSFLARATVADVLRALDLGLPALPLPAADAHGFTDAARFFQQLSDQQKAELCCPLLPFLSPSAELLSPSTEQQRSPSVEESVR